MQRTFHLESGESETLKVVPTRKVLSVSTFSKGGSVEKVGNVINLYFEGNWMPIKVCHLALSGYKCKAMFVLWHCGPSTITILQAPCGVNQYNMPCAPAKSESR